MLNAGEAHFRGPRVGRGELRLVGVLKHPRIGLRPAEVGYLRLPVSTSPTTAPGPGYTMGLALDIKPDLVTLMPEKPEEATSEGGLDLVLDRGEIGDTIATIRDGGIPVYLLVDPEPEQIKRAHRLNADGVQLHTAAYAGRASARTRDRLRDRLEDAAKVAAKLRLQVLAGGRLNYGNASAVGRIREIGACVIGHSIVSRALLTGMETAVRDMLILLEPR